MFEDLFKYPLEQFAKGRIRFGLAPELVILAAAVAVATAYYFYRKAPPSLGRKTRIALSALRGAALALLVAILFHPMLQVPDPVTKDCYVVVLADNSASMRIADGGPQGAAGDADHRRTRLDVVKDLLGRPGASGPGGKPGLVEALTETCPVRMFRFDREVLRLDDVGHLDGTGARTNLHEPLKFVDSRFRDVPVVGVVLVTDGARNDGGYPGDLARLLGQQERPVWCIGVGDPEPPKDLEILRVHAPQVVRANTNVEIRVNVRCHDIDEPFQVVLRHGREILQTAQIEPDPKVRVHDVPLSFRPEGRGHFKYTVEVPVHPDEVIRDNNRREFLVRVADPRLPVLYLEGSPREEYRFLRRALFRDKDFRIASILRLVNARAEQEVKGDRRKFITQGAEPEDGLEPKSKKDNGYPKTRKELYRFEAVIFGDIPADYLTPEQLKITEDFVAKRGGGFLMLGGVNSFNLGGYHGTPIEKMLPVELPKPDVPYQQVDVDIRVTEAGLKHSVMRQTEEAAPDGGAWSENRSVWSMAPKLIGYNPITRWKKHAGAQVLADDPKTGRPLLVVQRYGAGRTAAFPTGGSWHWQMALPQQDLLHEKFWRQLVRWLALGSKPRLSIRLNKDIFDLSDPVVIEATVRDHERNPVDNASVQAVVTDPFGGPRKLRMEWTITDPGVYRTQYTPIDAGDYRVDVEAKLRDEIETELTAVASFSVGETLEEFSDASQKVALLKELAENSRGGYYRPDQAGEIADLVKARARELRRDETVYQSHDIWDTPLLFAILAVALCAEWMLRRRSGLM